MPCDSDKGMKMLLDIAEISPADSSRVLSSNTQLLGIMLPDPKLSRDIPENCILPPRAINGAARLMDEAIAGLPLHNMFDPIHTSVISCPPVVVRWGCSSGYLDHSPDLTDSCDEGRRWSL